MPTNDAASSDDDDDDDGDDVLRPLSPAVADPVSVGTEKVLDSPHVSVGPGRLASAPVPSVFSDDRGEIHRLRVGGSRINLLFSRGGVMRSGYLHSHDMHDFVVRGSVEVWVLTETGTEKSTYGGGEYFVIGPWVPHILHFLEDTVMAEWWGSGRFECWYYHPYRRIIDVQNALVSKSKGIFQHLVPRDEGSASAPSAASGGRLIWWTAGMITGMIAGAYLAGSRGRR